MRWRGDGRRILDVATASAATLLVNVAGALLTTVYLPVEDRGTYVLLVTALAITAPLACLGANVGVRRARPTHPRPGRLDTVYLRLTVVGGLVHGALAPVVVRLVAGPESIPDATTVAAVCAIGVAQAWSWHLVELWYARLKFRRGAAYAVVHAAAGLAGAAVTAMTGSLVALLVTQAVLTLAVQAVQLVDLARTTPPTPTDVAAEDEPDRAMARAIIGVGIPSLVMTAGMTLTFRADRVLLGLMAGQEAVAIYSLAASLSEVPRFIPGAFGQIANGRAASTTTRLPLRPYVVPSLALTAAAAAAAMVLGLVAIPYLQPEYAAAVPVLLVLLVAELALVPYSIAIRMVLGAGRVTLSAKVGLVAVVLSAVLYTTAIAWFGLMGAAWASVAVYTLVSVASVMVHRQQGRSQ